MVLKPRKLWELKVEAKFICRFWNKFRMKRNEAFKIHTLRDQSHAEFISASRPKLNLHALKSELAYIKSRNIKLFPLFFLDNGKCAWHIWAGLCGWQKIKAWCLPVRFWSYHKKSSYFFFLDKKETKNQGCVKFWRNLRGFKLKTWSATREATNLQRTDLFKNLVLNASRSNAKFLKRFWSHLISSQNFTRPIGFQGI